MNLFKIKVLCTKLVYRLIRPHRGGHGIHSPFLYQLVTQVLYNKAATQAARKETLSLPGKYKLKYGRLLFKIARYFQPESIVVIGSHYVVPFFEAGEHNVNIVGIETKNLSKDSLRAHLNENRGFGILYVDCCDLNEAVKHSLFVGFSGCSNNSLIIFDHIRANEEIWNTWLEICDNEEVSLTLDLFVMGIAFFNKKLKKQHFKLYY